MRELISSARIQHFAARQDNFLNPHFRRSTFGGETADRNHVPWLENIFRPSRARQMIRAGESALPILNGPFFIFGVQGDDHVGIDELEDGHGTFYGD